MSKSAQDALKELDIISLNKNINIYATSDKTKVSLSPKDNTGNKSSEALHSSLMAAGFVPGMGNIADAADAILYAAEGEFGDAAWYAAAMVPFIGQFVSAKKALKVAKESGEEMVTLYRGVPKWYPGQMVKDGVWVGGKKFIGQAEKSKDPLSGWKTVSLEFQDEFVRSMEKPGLWVSGSEKYAKDFVSRFPDSRLLKFEVPKSFAKKHFTKTGQYEKEDLGFFLDGLPTEFLTSAKKIHK